MNVDEIRRQAVRLYDDFLRWKVGGLCRGKDGKDAPYFPLILTTDTAHFSESLAKKSSENAAALYAGSKNSTGTGYSLELETVSTRSHGRQSIIKRVYFASEQDYLQYVDKAAEVHRLSEALATIREELAADGAFLQDWAAGHIPALTAAHPGNFWHDACAAARWLRENPASGLYVREIPVQVPDSFIEEHKALIHSLSSGREILVSFEADHGLRSRPFAIRFRSLSAEHPLALGALIPQEIALPLDDFIHLDRSGLLTGITHVLIVENEMVYLTFPRSEHVLCVHAPGHATNVLKLCEWLPRYQIVYFGSAEAHGFGTLSALRSFFRETRSLCMDERTVRTFEPSLCRAEPPKPGAAPRFLSEEEKRAFRLLSEHPAGNSLPQEKLPLEYMKLRLDELTGARPADGEVA